MLEFLAWEILKMGRIGGVDLCWPKDVSHLPRSF